MNAFGYEMRAIQWVDSASLDGWHEHDAVDAGVCTTSTVFSVGYVVAEWGGEIVLAQSVEKHHFGELIAIPTRAIIDEAKVVTA